MKMFVAVALAVMAVASALPVEEHIPIVRSEFNPQPDGGYEFNFESGNGIVRSEKGELKEALDEENKPHTVVAVRGTYSYPGPEGPVSVVYYADETGYHAEGDSIPKPSSRR